VPEMQAQVSFLRTSDFRGNNFATAGVFTVGANLIKGN
jgi:hypothetical protein